MTERTDRHTVDWGHEDGIRIFQYLLKNNNRHNFFYLFIYNKSCNFLSELNVY
jgi:hypothetical protein